VSVQYDKARADTSCDGERTAGSAPVVSRPRTRRPASTSRSILASGAAYAEAARRATNVAERDHLVRQAARARAAEH
jgi:hypothetical protein